jgi:predicted RNA-binding protein with PUA-like domain
MKSEPSCYSIENLERDKTTPWDGVRNAQARNFMRDQMRTGDMVLFYHSCSRPPGIVGVARVCRESYPDFTAWDVNDKHYDPKSSKEAPRWFMVDVEFVGRFEKKLALDQIRKHKELANMALFKQSRLSVQSVEKDEYEYIIALVGFKA